MTPKQADKLNKQLDSLSKEEWRLFWRWITAAYMDAIGPKFT